MRTGGWHELANMSGHSLQLELLRPTAELIRGRCESFHALAQSLSKRLEV
jgi:hypothetical protein